ncbi:winged helix-turn-helix domain-containing protein [Halococcus qingdaonensis]|uniref:winged helix-turn-helix domain-containing protein n=1 Tax=Halococcus qingdaonensis TaxID=224402 RepID=UPI002115D0C0|nr:winged helix-turn-helix domain-containing protein [Halococcus qingdaonensis]
MTERDERGRYAPDHTDADILEAVREHDPAGTSEVADQLGIARQSADQRLRKLEEAGRVHRKKIGAVAVWWLDDEERATAEIDPDDGFWDADPGSSAEPTDATKTDEYLADALE